MIRTAIAPVALALVLLLAFAVQASAQHEAARLKVTKFRVTGNTLLDEASVQSTLKPYVGKALTLVEIKAAAKSLRQQYLARGFPMAFAYVPPQEFTDGTVEIRVQQGRIGQVRVEGNSHYTDEFIRRFFAPALKSGFVEEQSMQRALLTMNQFLDLRVRSALEAKSGGTVDITLKAVDRRQVHYTLDYDNFGVRLVGRNRVGAGVLAGNLLAEGDQLSVKTVYPFEVDGANAFAFGTYSIPVGDRGARVESSFAHAKTIVGGQFAVLGIEGDADLFSLRGSIPDRLDLRHNTQWTVELNAKNVVNSALGGQQRVSEDDVRTVGVGHRGTTLSRNGKLQIAYNAALLQGTGGVFGGSKKGDTGTSRAGADNEFTRLVSDFVAIQRLSDKTLLLGKLQAQVSGDGLMVPEQFALGGPDSVRGYQQGEFLGDNGYALTAEVRQTVFQRRRSQIQALAFFDHGYAKLEQPLPLERRDQSLTGAGVGMRGQFGESVSARADLGFCLDPDRNLDGDRAKLHTQISCLF